MPDALYEVFRVNDMLEDIGGLVDPEDLPEIEGSGAGRDGNSGVGEHNEPDSIDTDRTDYATPVKKTFVTSCPGTDGSSISAGGSSNSSTRRTRQTPASLVDKLLSSISPDAEARQNNERAVMRLYLQQIWAHEDTIRMRELQNDALRKELTLLQDKLQTTTHELSRTERQADKLKMRLEVLEMMGAHRGRSSRRHHTHRMSLSPNSDDSMRSSWYSHSPPRSTLRSKRRCVNLPGTSMALDRGKEKIEKWEKGDVVEVPAPLMDLQSGTGGSLASE